MVPPQDDFTVSASLSATPSLTRTTLMVVTLNKRPLFSLFVSLYVPLMSKLFGLRFLNITIGTIEHTCSLFKIVQTAYQITRTN